MPYIDSNTEEYRNLYHDSDCSLKNLINQMETIRVGNLVKFKRKRERKRKRTLYICKHYFKHLLEKMPYDFKHQVHKWTLGIILINHQEPNGFWASSHHKIII